MSYTRGGRLCGAMRQQDEWHCPMCEMRWDATEDKPGCNPIMLPVEINNYAANTKARLQQNKKRARKYGSFR